MPSYHAPVPETIDLVGRRRRRLNMEASNIILPAYELYECSSDLRVLLRAIMDVRGDLEGLRTVLVWNRLRPGEAPPSRELLLQFANFLSITPAPNCLHNVLVMHLMTDLARRIV